MNGKLRLGLPFVFVSLHFFALFMKIYLKKVVRLIYIFITLFSNRHIIRWQRSVI